MADNKSAVTIVTVLGVVVIATGVGFAVYKNGHSVSKEFPKLTAPQHVPLDLSSMSPGASSSGAGKDNPADLVTFRKPSQELIAKGKELFAVNCVSCHGVEGRGDGVAAAAINPKPRNFHATEGWKNGRTPLQMFKTLKEGIPGGSMASFSYLSVKDRWSVIHYVRTFETNPPDDDASAVKALEDSVGTAGSAGSTPAIESISVHQAMEDIVDQQANKVVNVKTDQKLIAAQHPGAGIYATRCISCHGESGEGRTRGIGINPTSLVRLPSFTELKNSDTMRSGSTFENFIVKGVSGKSHPAQADLNSEEVRELKEFVDKLAM